MSTSEENGPRGKNATLRITKGLPVQWDVT